MTTNRKLINWNRLCLTNATFCSMCYMKRAFAFGAFDMCDATMSYIMAMAFTGDESSKRRIAKHKMSLFEKCFFKEKVTAGKKFNLCNSVCKWKKIQYSVFQILYIVTKIVGVLLNCKARNMIKSFSIQIDPVVFICGVAKMSRLNRYNHLIP